VQPIALILPQAIRPLVALLEFIGEPLPRLPAALRTGNVLLPLVCAGFIWERAVLATGDENVGLSVGAASRFEEIPLGQLVRGSLTIGAGLATAARESSRYNTGHRLWITERDGDVWVQRRFVSALRRGRRQANDFSIQMVIDFIRRGAGPHWRPAELYLEGPPPTHAEELAALATDSTHFGAATDCLVFPRSVLAMPLRPRERHLLPVLPPPPADFAASVRATIQSILELGELELPILAEAAGTSVRSLQRRLAAEGLSFSRLVDEARFQAASALLRDPDVRIVDVSAELGYTDAANFTRAFRRWAGVPPLAFRRAQLGPAIGVR
jgi:AraC-like DNA-binding protein